MNGDEQIGNENKHSHHRRHRPDIDRYLVFMFVCSFQIFFNTIVFCYLQSERNDRVDRNERENRDARDNRERDIRENIR